MLLRFPLDGGAGLFQFGRMEYTVERQISLALENQPGVLARVCDALGARGINIRALSIIDNVEQGMVRLITSDAALALEVLKDQGLHPIQADVIDLRPVSMVGRLSAIAHALADAGINIDYAYGSDAGSARRMSLILRVSNVAGALAVLEALPVE